VRDPEEVLIIAVGQCAAFGGYPACISPVLMKDSQGLVNGASQTGALGVYDFLNLHGSAGAKVINAPGCPTNPRWFVLTVVAWLVDFVNPGTLGILDSSHNIIATSVDSTRRLKAVYGIPLHGPACSRYQDFLNGNFATHPGQSGCLQLIGCKGPSAKSLCHVHGWNALQPRNDGSWENSHNSLSVNSKGVRSVAPARWPATPAWPAPRRAIRTASYPSWCARKGRREIDGNS
jgi:hydrogenase small subunit